MAGFDLFNFGSGSGGLFSGNGGGGITTPEYNGIDTSQLPTAQGGGSGGGSAESLGGFDFESLFSSGGGDFASMLGAKGGKGTGGQFTKIGFAVGGPIGGGIGAALDLGFSSRMADKARNKAKKAAKKYWKDARVELGQIQKRHRYGEGGTMAKMGASGASLGSGSLVAYRAEERAQHQLEYNRAYKDFRSTYHKIKKSGGKGGLF